MKLAGCWSVALAPETGDLKNLKKINKDLTLDSVEHAAELCRKLDMFFRVFIILGFPFDTPQSIQETDDFIKKINPDLLTVNLYTPFPKTTLYEQYHLDSKMDTGYYEIPHKDFIKKAFQRMTVFFYLHPRTISKCIRHLSLKQFFNVYMQYIRLFLTYRMKTR